MSLSRRSFLKCMACAAGAAVGTRIAGGSRFIGEARADNEKPAVLMIFLAGGYNALFGSADGLNGRFGVNEANMLGLGNGLVVDSTFGMLSQNALSRMATIGVRHGLTDHDDSQMMKWWSNGNRSYPLMLANALGGDGAIKAAVVGDGMPPGPRPAEGDVTLQSIRDMEPTISALGGAQNDPRLASRGVAASALERSAAMSKHALGKNKKSLESLEQAYPTASKVLRKPVKAFSFQDLSNAYGLEGRTSVDDFRAQIAAAELMILSGTNVVVAFEQSRNWDTHGDRDGVEVRNNMSEVVLPPLKTFLDRMMADADRNVVVAIAGDFARSLPDSDHQPNCAVTVIGRYVKTGTTGRVNANVDMAPSTPDIPHLWSYLASVTKTPANPFGANPHASLVL